MAVQADSVLERDYLLRLELITLLPLAQEETQQLLQPVLLLVMTPYLALLLPQVAVAVVLTLLQQILPL